MAEKWDLDERWPELLDIRDDGLLHDTVDAADWQHMDRTAFIVHTPRCSPGCRWKCIIR